MVKNDVQLTFFYILTGENVVKLNFLSPFVLLSPYFSYICLHGRIAAVIQLLISFEQSVVALVIVDELHGFAINGAERRVDNLEVG